MSMEGARTVKAPGRRDDPHNRRCASECSANQNLFKSIIIHPLPSNLYALPTCMSLASILSCQGFLAEDMSHAFECDAKQAAESAPMTPFRERVNGSAHSSTLASRRHHHPNTVRSIALQNKTSHARQSSALDNLVIAEQCFSFFGLLSSWSCCRVWRPACQLPLRGWQSTG